ncbi:hypothetical protein Tco_1419203 [Tanacetum coccineum]
MTTPSPSPPISLSPPSAGERLARCTAPPAHSPPLPPSSGCLTQIQTLRIASTQALIDAVTAALPNPASSTTTPTISIQAITYAEERPGRRNLLSHERGYTGLAAILEMHMMETSRIVEEGGLCFPRVLGSFDRIECTRRLIMSFRPILIDVYAHENLSTGTPEYSYSCQSNLDSNTTPETLRVIRDMRREMSDMQTELLALRETQRRARQPGPEARIPDHQEASRDADSHI